MKYLKNNHQKTIEGTVCWTEISRTEKFTSKNEFIFHPVKVLQNMLYLPRNLKL